MTDWARLRHAYGSAADVPALLAAARADADDRVAWDGLWSRLCHQGTVCSASYPALPALATMAAQRPAAGYNEPLHLAAAIIASDDGHEDFRIVLRDYAAEVAALHGVAERSLSVSDDSIGFVYVVQAVMAFEGASPWNRRLQALADEELTLDCPGCGGYLTISFDSTPATTTALDDGLPVTVVTPADPGRLHDAPARIHALASRHAQVAVGRRALYLFGNTVCPACAITIDIPSTLGP